jgi:iron(III) transport system substrate-binding protein
MMGEDEGFKFLAAMNKNVNQYTRSGSAGIRAAGEGRDDDRHHVPARLRSRRRVQGYPIKTSRPAKARLRDHLVGDHQGGPNPEGRGNGWTSCCRRRAERRVAREQVPDPSNRTHRSSDGDQSRRVKLIKLDLDKYGSKEGRERLCRAGRENEVFKAPK